MFKNSNKGVSLYLALIIMFILIAIALGVSLIIVSQMKMMKGMGDSVVAFYAADTGIEQALYEKRVNGIDWSGSGSVGGANYAVNYTGGSEAKWQSKGTFQGVSRAIEITHPVVFDFSFTVAPTYLCMCVDTSGYDPVSMDLTATIISDPNPADTKTAYFYLDNVNPPFDSDVTSSFPAGNSCSLTLGSPCTRSLEFNGQNVALNQLYSLTLRAVINNSAGNQIDSETITLNFPPNGLDVVEKPPPPCPCI
jgi:hypothetical protein